MPTLWPEIKKSQSALQARSRLFTLQTVNGKTQAVEINNPVELSVRVVTDAKGAASLDYAAMGFTSIQSVKLSAEAATAALNQMVRANVVGTPTITKITIQTTRPAAVQLLGALSTEAAPSVPVWISITGVAPNL